MRRATSVLALLVALGCSKKDAPEGGGAAPPVNTFGGPTRVAWPALPDAVRAASDARAPAGTFAYAEHLPIKGELSANAPDFIKDLAARGAGSPPAKKSEPAPPAQPPTRTPPPKGAKVAGAYFVVHERKGDPAASPTFHVYVVGPDNAVVFDYQPLDPGNWSDEARFALAD
jgi:hypothetical protein